MMKVTCRMAMDLCGLILMRRNWINHLIWIENGRGGMINSTLWDIVMELQQGKKPLHKRDLMQTLSSHFLLDTTGVLLGLVRGVASALACLPDELKEMLIKTRENRAKSQDFHESVHSLSTTDALRLFNDNIVTSKAVEPSEHTETSSSISGLQEHHVDCSPLENHFRELQSLLLETPAIQVHLGVHK